MESYYVGFLDNDEPHFLEFCSLCHKTLAFNSDIFMYRGDMAFCSEDCRQKQIEFDETKKSKSWRKTSSSSSSRSSLWKSSDSKNSDTEKTVRAKTLVVA